MLFQAFDEIVGLASVQGSIFVADQNIYVIKHYLPRILCGAEGIRTLGLLVANEALSQLSYSPKQ